jgi:hypothetical protein
MTPLSSPAAAKPTIAAERLAGIYYSRTTMTVRRFTATQGQLLAGNDAGEVLEPLGASVYRARSGAEFRFEDGRLLVMPPSGKSDRFERVAQPPVAAFSKVAGDYWSAELALAIKVTIENGKLIWHAPENALALRFTDAELSPISESVLAGPGFVVAFDPNGFVLGTGRARGMRFVKR